MGLFGVEPVATVGIGMGATTMERFLEVHGLLPRLASHTDVYVIVVEESTRQAAERLVRALRSEGVKVEMDITGRKVDKQLKTASRKHIPFAVFVGPEEVASALYTVKNLVESTEQQVDVLRMISVVKDGRYDSDDDAVFEI